MFQYATAKALLLENNSINFRFDLYGSKPIYKNVEIKSAYFSSIIENSIQKSFENENFFVEFPSKIDDSILRYIEYQECYSEKPDKIKHINYTEDQISKKGIDLDVFLDKLHFIHLSQKYWKKELFQNRGF